MFEALRNGVQFRAMPSERIQRRIDKFLDQAEEAADQKNWPEVRELARRALRLDADNTDAKAFVEMALASPAGGRSVDQLRNPSVWETVRRHFVPIPAPSLDEVRRAEP